MGSCWNNPALKPINEQLSVVQPDGTIPMRKTFDQNWSDNIRDKFWFTSQGSQIIPYKWIVHLERTDSRQLFRNVDHMNSLGYIPVESSSANPGGLPIGFAVDFDQKTGRAWVGLTCAACHTNQLNYSEYKILVEGAPALANFTKFFSELVQSLSQTYTDEAKFDRFANDVLGTNHSPDQKQELREELFDISNNLAKRRIINDLPQPAYPKDYTGYARLDAFGQITNQNAVFALDGEHLNNGSLSNAPVSYPFLWGTPQSDVVQWNGIAPNTPIIGPIVRNTSEVTGVFGKLNIDPAPWWKFWDFKHSYTSTVQINNLGLLEKWIVDLRSPGWTTTNYLPNIDPTKSATGESIFIDKCSACHQIIKREKEGDKYKAKMIPITSLNTDPNMAENIDTHTSMTYVLEGKKKFVLFGDPFLEKTISFDITVNGVIGIILEHPFKAFEAGKTGLVGNDYKDHLEKLAIEGAEDIEDLPKKIEILKKSIEMYRNEKKNADPIPKYKARPLNGIWATAPYLHNGSVPNLWQLLKEPHKRVESFYVGNRNFDPKKVGFETSEVSGSSSLFQVKNGSNLISGNSNKGHDYGTGLSDDQKFALIEFMKTL